jgi:hypothetical protein
MSVSRWINFCSIFILPLNQSKVAVYLHIFVDTGNQCNYSMSFTVIISIKINTQLEEQVLKHLLKLK